MIPTLEWLPEGVNFLDQTKLPLEETYVLATDYKQVAVVIKDMIVRGAMAIGVSAAMGVALGIDRSTAANLPPSTAEVDLICKTLAETRPTAVNLFWGIAQVRTSTPPSPRATHPFRYQTTGSRPRLAPLR